jgi:hypothetical protein
MMTEATTSLTRNNAGQPDFCVAINAGGASLESSLSTNSGNLLLSDDNFTATLFSTNDGVIALDNPAKLDVGGAVLNNSGEWNGNGIVVSGSFTNEGTIRPGLSGGLLIEGNAALDINGSLNIEIGGDESGEHGFMDVNGIADLGGTLNVTLVNNFFR